MKKRLRGQFVGGWMPEAMAKWVQKTISFYEENLKTFERVTRLGFTKFNFHRAPGTSFLTRCCVRLFENPAAHINEATNGRVQLTQEEVERLYYKIMQQEAEADGRLRER